MSEKRRLLWRIQAPEGTFYTNATTSLRARNKALKAGATHVNSVTAIADGDSREGAWRIR